MPPGPRGCGDRPGGGRQPEVGRRTGEARRGRGLGRPSFSMKVPRAAMCGWSIALVIGRTGATQASVPSKISAPLGLGPVRKVSAISVRSASAFPGRTGPARVLDAEQLDEERRRTAAPARRRTCARRRRSRRRRRRARRRRAGWPPAPPCRLPPARNAAVIAFRWAVPSTIAASTTWPLPAEPGLEEGGEDADHEVRRPAAEVADQVGREVRLLLDLAQAVEGAGDGDVVHVVPGRLRPADRPGPSRSSGRRRAAGCGPWHSSGPRPSRSATPGRIPSISTSALLDQVEHRRDRLGLLEVERHARAAAVEQVVRAAGERLSARAGRSGSRRRPGRPGSCTRAGPADPGDLDHLHALQGPVPIPARTSCGRF